MHLLPHLETIRKWRGVIKNDFYIRLPRLHLQINGFSIHPTVKSKSAMRGQLGECIAGSAAAQ